MRLCFTTFRQNIINISESVSTMKDDNMNNQIFVTLKHCRLFVPD